jgi:hypothetical protein
MRVVLFVVGAYVASEHTVPQPCHFEEARAGWASMPYQWKEGLGLKLVGVWERWDACWYVKLATYGYRRGEGVGDGGFFPLYPALLRIGGAGWDPTYAVAGLVVSAVALVLALWGLHRLLARDLSPGVARRTMLFVAIAPGAIFLFAPFTESVFLALAVWTIDAARRRRWVAALILALGAGATRPVGVALALPLAWLALRPWLDGERDRRDLLGIPAAIAPLVAFAGFAAYARSATGEGPIEQAGRMGSASFSPPWDVIGASIRWTIERGDPLQALNLALLALFIALVVVGARQLPLELTLYAAPLLAVLATRINPIPLSGTSRYLVVVFPALAVLALAAERPRLAWTWAIISLLFLALLAHTFVRGDFVA